MEERIRGASPLKPDILSFKRSSLNTLDLATYEAWELTEDARGTDGNGTGLGAEGNQKTKGTEPEVVLSQSVHKKVIATVARVSEKAKGKVTVVSPYSLAKQVLLL